MTRHHCAVSGSFAGAAVFLESCLLLLLPTGRRLSKDCKGEQPHSHTSSSTVLQLQLFCCCHFTSSTLAEKT
jgi:hypothetical protein